MVAAVGLELADASCSASALSSGCYPTDSILVAESQEAAAICIRGSQTRPRDIFTPLRLQRTVAWAPLVPQEAPLRLSTGASLLALSAGGGSFSVS